MPVLHGIMVALATGDRQAPSSNPIQDKFLKNANKPFKMSGGVEPHRDRINNNNNNNDHSLIYAHIYSRPTAQVHTVSKYMQI